MDISRRGFVGLAAGALVFGAFPAAASSLPATKRRRVWHISEAGCDITGDGSAERPFRTYKHIEHNGAVEGQTIYLAGYYGRRINLDTPIIRHCMVYLRPLPGAAPSRPAVFMFDHGDEPFKFPVREQTPWDAVGPGGFYTSLHWPTP